jgi:hypothetical protein
MEGTLREKIVEDMKLYEKRRLDFEEHYENGICQKCGSKQPCLNCIGLMSSFDDKFKHVEDEKLEYVHCNPCSCIVLCDSCYKEMLLWLNIPDHDPMNEEI